MADVFGRKAAEAWERLCDENDALRAQRDALLAALEAAATELEETAEYIGGHGHKNATRAALIAATEARKTIAAVKSGG